MNYDKYLGAPASRRYELHRLCDGTAEALREFTAWHGPHWREAGVLKMQASEREPIDVVCSRASKIALEFEIAVEFEFQGETVTVYESPGAAAMVALRSDPIRAIANWLEHEGGVDGVDLADAVRDRQWS